MSILGAYRQSSNIAAYPISSSGRVINISGYKPSGIEYGCLLGAALYVWSGPRGAAKGFWTPLEVGMLK